MYIGAIRLNAAKAGHSPGSYGAIDLCPYAWLKPINEMCSGETSRVLFIHVSPYYMDPIVHMDMIKQAGGSEWLPKFDMISMGFYAYAKDPSGSVIGLWEDAKK